MARPLLLYSSMSRLSPTVLMLLINMTMGAGCGDTSETSIDVFYPSPDAAPIPQEPPPRAAPDAGPDPDPAASALLANPHFDLPAMDTGNLTNDCFMAAPWGESSWGVDAETFSDPSKRQLAAARFVSWGHEGYLYGKEDAGRWGFVRFIQGDAWGGGNCGPIPWHKFAPLPTHGKDVRMKLSIWRDTNRLTSPASSWIMFAINVWFSSPDLPQAGGDVNHRKPLVMDLIFHHECNAPGCHYGSYEDASAYHYQAFIGETPARQWGTFDFSLSEHITAAADFFHLSAAALAQLKLYQVEFLIELKNAEGAATIDDYVVTAE